MFPEDDEEPKKASLTVPSFHFVLLYCMCILHCCFLSMQLIKQTQNNEMRQKGHHIHSKGQPDSVHRCCCFLLFSLLQHHTNSNTNTTTTTTITTHIIPLLPFPPSLLPTCLLSLLTVSFKAKAEMIVFTNRVFISKKVNEKVAPIQLYSNVKRRGILLPHALSKCLCLFALSTSFILYHCLSNDDDDDDVGFCSNKSSDRQTDRQRCT